jgi:hypothetical protein
MRRPRLRCLDRISFGTLHADEEDSLGSMSRPYTVVTLYRLQVRQTADSQPLFVPHAPIDHPVDMLREYLPRLHDHRFVATLQLLINI